LPAASLVFVAVLYLKDYGVSKQMYAMGEEG